MQHAIFSDMSRDPILKETPQPPKFSNQLHQMCTSSPAFKEACNPFVFAFVSPLHGTHLNPLGERVKTIREVYKIFNETSK